MRTTLTLEDSIAQAFKDEAHRSGRSFKAVANDALRRGLSASARQSPRRWKQRTASLGGPLPGVDQTKALVLAGALEDDEIARKLELRK